MGVALAICLLAITAQLMYQDQMSHGTVARAVTVQNVSAVIAVAVQGVTPVIAVVAAVMVVVTDAADYQRRF